MEGKYTNVKIAGMASAVPSLVMDNKDYIDLFGKRRVLKQVKMTGVERCHKSLRYQKTSDLCMCAARRLIEHLKWDLSQIKILIFITQNSDYDIPSTAMDLAERLGLGKDCMAYDISLGCSAFDLGIQTIAGLLQSQPDGTKALLFTGDVAPALGGGNALDKEGIINQLMFGSGGAAVAIEKEPENDFVFCNYADGSGWDAILKYRHTDSMMDGNKVLDYAFDVVADNMNCFRKSISEDNINYYCFSQAQKLILDSIVDCCKLPEEKFLTSYEEYGDTSGAGIPITLCHNRHKFLGKDKVNICSCGFGVGLSMGISFFHIDPQNILPVIETDEHFDDHINHAGYLYKHKILLANADTALMQMVGRQLDRVGGNLSLYGKQEQIRKLQSQLFFKDCDLYAGDFKQVVEKNKYHAVIFDMQACDLKGAEEKVHFLNDENALAENSNIVLVVKEEGNDSPLREFMSRLSEQCDCRVNALSYVPESFDLFPDIGDSMAWVERQLETSDTQNMTRPFILGSAMIRLLTMDFVAVDQTVIHISDTVSRFHL